MLQSEMSIQEVVKACASFRGADGRHLLHLCFDNGTEYDTDVIFDKNAISVKMSFISVIKAVFSASLLQSSVSHDLQKSL